MNYESFSGTGSSMRPVGNLGPGGYAGGAGFGSGGFGNYSNLGRSDLYGSSYPVGTGGPTTGMGFAQGYGNYGGPRRGDPRVQITKFTRKLTHHHHPWSDKVVTAEWAMECMVEEEEDYARLPKLSSKCLTKGNESAVAPILQRCGQSYYTSKPLLSRLAKFKGLLSGLLGGGRCSNVYPEYMEVIATEGGEEVVEVFRENCPTSIFDNIKNKFKGKLRQIGGEIKQGAQEFKNDIDRGIQTVKEEVRSGAHHLAMKFEDLRTMEHFKLFGAHKHECATLTPEQIYSAPNGFFRMMSRQCFLDLSPDCMAAIPPPQIPRIKWWKYATAEKVAALPPKSLIYLPFKRLGKKALKYSDTKNYLEKDGGGDCYGTDSEIENHPCLGIGEEQEEFLMRDRKVRQQEVQRCKAGTGPSKILIVILMVFFIMILLGLMTISLLY